uniref:Alpha-ketoglutarate-dependent dioxygenase AlkB-like domain-containing protein n=1 Tax=Mycena chlorophos TaxID=658473 RepID=A0ABQ0LBT5_MYCCL|nr:predicted protein [Mycena chlorophos]
MEPIFNLSEHRVPGPATCYYIPDFITVEEEQYLIGKIKDSPQQRWKQLANRRWEQLLVVAVVGRRIDVKQCAHRAAHASLCRKLSRYYRAPATNRRIHPLSTRQAESYHHERSLFSDASMAAMLTAMCLQYRPGQGECYVTYFTANPPNPPTFKESWCAKLFPRRAEPETYSYDDQPHEDGPAYHPVVATFSLQSHCVFHYYRYKENEDGPETAGKSIDPTPVLSVLLEPRSVVISQDDLYASHLHAIREVDQDVIHSTLLEIDQSMRLPIANRDKLTSPSAIQFVNEGGTLKRETRYSLTCRDVQKVVQLKALFGKR